MAMFLSPAKQPSNSVTLKGTSPYKKILQPTGERMQNLLVPQRAQASLALRGDKQGTMF